MEPHTNSTETISNSAPGSAPQSMFQSAMPTPTVTPSTIPVPAAAEDMDTIEPEWVKSVETVVQTYQGDPYNLTAAMAMLRTEYLSKRYGKDLGRVS